MGLCGHRRTPVCLREINVSLLGATPSRRGTPRTPPLRQGDCGPLDPGMIGEIQTGEIAETRFNRRGVRAAGCQLNLFIQR